MESKFDPNRLWTAAKRLLKDTLPKDTFNLYFNGDTNPITIKNGTFYLSGNIKSKAFFEIQQKDSLIKTFKDLAVNVTDIVVLTDADIEMQKTIEDMEENTDNEKSSDKMIELAKSISNANLNPKYTFDTFITGSSNNVASAACQRVAEYDDKSYNPLFLYGGVGLGKTHLMHAIGHKVLENSPSKKVLYVSSETFTNELVQAIRSKNNNKFREKYRNVDLFMIDDVQFIAGKDSMEEELFHTFNDIYAAGKKIVLSSDRPPKEIKGLPERLQSRFTMGFMADIQPPDYSTRMAILIAKAKTDNVKMDKEIIEYIADNIQSNIRELEGALNRVIKYADLSQKELNLSTAKEALKDILASYNTTKEVNIVRIKEMVSIAYNVSLEDLNSKKRSKNIVFPRQVAMYLARTMLDISLPSIGDEFGGKDHTTVMHAIKKVEDEISKSDTIRVKIEKIKSDLNG